MTDHIDRARKFLTRPAYAKPFTTINAGPVEGEEMAPSELMIRWGQAEALLAIAEGLHMANLIACSVPVYIRDAPDKIREHFGEAPLGSPEFDKASLTAMFERDLRQGLEEYFTDDEFSGSVFRDLEGGEIGVDGMLNLPALARFLSGRLMHRG